MQSDSYSSQTCGLSTISASAAEMSDQLGARSTSSSPPDASSAIAPVQEQSTQVQKKEKAVVPKDAPAGHGSTNLSNGKRATHEEHCSASDHGETPPGSQPPEKKVKPFDEDFSPSHFVQRVETPNRCVALFGMGSDESMPGHALKALSTHSSIQSSEFIRARKTGELKGFGFINYFSVKEAIAVVKKYSGKGLNVNGFRVRVDFSRTIGAAFQRDFDAVDSRRLTGSGGPQRDRGRGGSRGRSRSPRRNRRGRPGGGKRGRSRSRDRFYGSRAMPAPQIVYVSAADGSVISPPPPPPQGAPPYYYSPQMPSIPPQAPSTHAYAVYAEAPQAVPRTSDALPARGPAAARAPPPAPTGEAPPPHGYAAYAAAPQPLPTSGGYYYFAGPPPPGAQLVYDASQPPEVTGHNQQWYAAPAPPRPAPPPAYEPHGTAAYYAVPPLPPTGAQPISAPAPQYDLGHAYYYPPQPGPR